MSKARIIGIPAWIPLLAILVLTAVSALIPLQNPRLPGTLRVGVLAGEDPQGLQRAFGLFAQYLGASIKRSGAVVEIEDARVRAGAAADLWLVPGSWNLGDAEGFELLAWIKPLGRSGTKTPTILVTRRGPALEPIRLGLGDRFILGGRDTAIARLREHGVDLAAAEPVIGCSPYRHDEIIALFRHGAIEAMVVSGDDFDRTVRAMEIDLSQLRVEVIEESARRWALVAGPSLSKPARRRLRSRALDLDHLRFESNNGPVSGVVQSLAQLSIGGFAPIEPFPSLRP